MSARRPAFALGIALLLACSGVEELVKGEPGAATAPGAAAEDDEDTASLLFKKDLPKATSYGANVYGVCRKYHDCDCNDFGTLAACVDAFGKTKSKFPEDTWSCVLARDCEGLCEMDSGTCFTVHALLTVKEKATGDRPKVECGAGEKPIDLYDPSGRFLRTECR